MNIGDARSFTFDSVYSSYDAGMGMDAQLFEKYVKGMVSGLLSGLNATVGIAKLTPLMKFSKKAICPNRCVNDELSEDSTLSMFVTCAKLFPLGRKSMK